MAEAKVGDIEIYYEVHGKGTPLLMIMGWGSSSERWDRELIEELSESHKVVVFDNRGTGRSGKPDTEYTTSTMAEDVAGLMDAVGIEKAHILGESMGGMIAQEVAIKRPEKVLSLILCCTSSGGRGAVYPEEFLDVLRKFASGCPPEMTEEEMMRWKWKILYTPGFVRVNREKLLSEAAITKYPTPTETYAKHARAILSHDAYDRLHLIRAPTLIITGEKDPATPPENSRILAEGILDSRLRIFKGARHGFIWEMREQTASEILGFLSKVDLEGGRQ